MFQKPFRIDIAWKAGFGGRHAEGTLGHPASEPRAV